MAICIACFDAPAELFSYVGQVAAAFADGASIVAGSRAYRKVIYANG